MWTFSLRNPLPVLACVAAVGLPACAVDEVPPVQGAASLSAGLATEGALIHMEMPSRVGVLLDEIPAGPQREQAAAEAMSQSTAAWQARAQRQVRLTYYRLVFRGDYYPSDWANASKNRGPLPLPPTAVWTIAISGAPHRVTTPQHDAVVADYTFDTHILTDAASPGDVEPALASVGGAWDESFNLPLDPELLLERTGYACMDEDEYPAGSVFEENTWYFYDDTCTGASTAASATPFRPTPVPPPAT